MTDNDNNKNLRSELSDGVVTIRKYRMSDITSVYEAAIESREELAPFMPWCHPKYSIKDTEEWVSSRGDAWDAATDYSFTIVDSKSGRFLGGAGVNQISHMHKYANVGYWVRSSEHGKGIATRSALLSARFAFEDLGLMRVEISAVVDNAASCRVAEKTGSMREGVLRNRLFIHEKSHDTVMFSLVPEDLK